MEKSNINFNSLGEYCLDAWQRSVLFLDILRERGDNTLLCSITPRQRRMVLGFSAELIRDGRKLERPVNLETVVETLRRRLDRAFSVA